jgi:hypothetical protein
MKCLNNVDAYSATGFWLKIRAKKIPMDLHFKKEFKKIHKIIYNEMAKKYIYKQIMNK